MMAMSEERRQALKKMLFDRRREIESCRPPTTGKYEEYDGCEEIDIYLAETREENLDRLRRAERQLAEGTYGSCLGCRDEISLERLSALPFVVICKRCDDEAELQVLRERVPGNRWGRLFAL
ncbi:MAG: hypothetical protein A2758_01405 [Candidatus Zambryskibacteria bacterium RIFCSPHIGHO2_01_FULL_49_18]|uniref:Zinc finger DksA/TraR C4-type domain-containing protein n=2 Tax=Candidatus Zambryskiibacteriota TaxID=1817925 RepID=A0A1G2T171_9BACT|nr:MAG: hypothetical protein A2758_01405 [Candidatus Zambryskibacteria bacterium RIFCSPHIGHO2_01_FULL_49_18]OHB05303.1 MAG: hypothetical protein A3A26_01790 [Candidatus Zambryskibacteria bacterium RIFCSPLOWO2_01_FULL_47_14]